MPTALKPIMGHPSWASPVPNDPRIEAMCRRFCRMAGIDPDRRVRLGVPEAGNLPQPAWVQYKIAMAQYLDAADSCDPMRPEF